MADAMVGERPAVWTRSGSSECSDGSGQIVDRLADRYVNGVADHVQPVGLQLGRAIGQTRGVVICDHQLATGPEPACAGQAHSTDAHDHDDLSHPAAPIRRSNPLREYLFSTVTPDKFRIYGLGSSAVRATRGCHVRYPRAGRGSVR